MKKLKWIKFVLLFLCTELFAQHTSSVLLAEQVPHTSSILVSPQKEKISNAISSGEKKYSPLTTPKGAVFCRMENALSKKYKLNLRIRTGGF